MGTFYSFPFTTHLYLPLYPILCNFSYRASSDILTGTPIHLNPSVVPMSQFTAYLLLKQPIYLQPDRCQGSSPLYCRIRTFRIQYGCLPFIELKISSKKLTSIYQHIDFYKLIAAWAIKFNF